MVFGEGGADREEIVTHSMYKCWPKGHKALLEKTLAYFCTTRWPARGRSGCEYDPKVGPGTNLGPTWTTTRPELPSIPNGRGPK